MNKWINAVALIVVCGCTATPPGVDSGLAMPATWRYATTRESAERVHADWCTAFGSDELDAYVRKATANSFDIAAAIARVKQAEARTTIAGAALLPGVSGFADVGRQGGLLVSDSELAGTSFDLGIAASYEIDFWGRNRAIRDEARANLNASRFDRDTVTLTVAAETANAWVETVAARQRTDIAQQNLDTATRILTFVESRFRAGSATQLDVAQQRAAVATQRRALEARREDANESLTTLAVLMGQPVSEVRIVTASLDALRVPDIEAGVPSALLVRRPDLARAEAHLAAADANITAARAAMLPNLTLTGTAGFGSGSIHAMFENPLYSIAAGLAAPIFDAGSLAAQRDLAVAQKEELLADYRSAIIAAFGDVERSLTAIQGVDAQLAAHNEELQETRRALQLAQSRYVQGAETLVVVLAAQQALFDAEDAGVQLRLARLQGAVSLYRALGGGWENYVTANQEVGG